MKKKLINSYITIGLYKEFIENIVDLSNSKMSSYVCVANVHMLIEAYKNEEFAEIVNNADIVTPDGMPLAKSIKYLYNIHQDRAAGMDLMPDLIKKSSDLNKKIFLYGSSSEILEKIEKKVKQEYSTIQIKSYSPPFRELNDNEKNEIVNMINDYNPNFVFVALGCPKQEKWMSEHKKKINACMIGLGGAFEVYAGVKHRAPKWMQRHSLEWLYRFIQDPKRLWKRYLYTNSLFILLFFKQFLFDKLINKDSENDYFRK